jgi:hypothetical protein
MNIAIIGIRGIPNHYGGFEYFAEYLSIELEQKGLSITVYNRYKHPFQESNYNGVELIHSKGPELKIGTAVQFICDFDSAKKIINILLS